MLSAEEEVKAEWRSTFSKQRADAFRWRPWRVTAAAKNGLYLKTVCHLLTSPQSLFVLQLESLTERVMLMNTHSRVTMKSEVKSEDVGAWHCL